MNKFSSKYLFQFISINYLIVCNPYLIIMIISRLLFKNYPAKHLTNNQWENHMFKNLFTPDCLSSIFYMILCHTFPSCNLDDILSCKNIFTPIIWRKSYTCEKINDSTDIYIGPCSFMSQWKKFLAAKYLSKFSLKFVFQAAHPLGIKHIGIWTRNSFKWWLSDFTFSPLKVVILSIVYLL